MLRAGTISNVVLNSMIPLSPRPSDSTGSGRRNPTLEGPEREVEVEWRNGRVIDPCLCRGDARVIAQYPIPHIGSSPAPRRAAPPSSAVSMVVLATSA